MVRRIGFDDAEGSGAVRRRGQRWRADRIVETHKHPPATPESRAARIADRYRRQAGVASAQGAEPQTLGRILRKPIVFILGLIFFHVFFIAFLIIRAIWLARQSRGRVMDV